MMLKVVCLILLSVSFCECVFTPVGYNPYNGAPRRPYLVSSLANALYSSNNQATLNNAEAPKSANNLGSGGSATSPQQYAVSQQQYGQPQQPQDVQSQQQQYGQVQQPPVQQLQPPQVQQLQPPQVQQPQPSQYWLLQQSQNFQQQQPQVQQTQWQQYDQLQQPQYGQLQQSQVLQPQQPQVLQPQQPQVLQPQQTQVLQPQQPADVQPVQTETPQPLPQSTQKYFPNLQQRVNAFKSSADPETVQQNTKSNASTPPIESRPLPFAHLRASFKRLTSSDAATAPAPEESVTPAPQVVPLASQQYAPPAQQQYAPTAPQQNFQPAPQQYAPLAQQQIAPTAPQQNIQLVPEQYAPPAQQQNAPTAPQQNIQPVPRQYAPPAQQQYAPTAPQQNFQPAPQQYAPLAQQQIAPTAPQQNIQLVPEQYAPPAQQQIAQPAPQQNIQPVPWQYAPPAQQQIAPTAPQQNIQLAQQQYAPPAQQQNASTAQQQYFRAAPQQYVPPATQQFAQPAPQKTSNSALFPHFARPQPTPMAARPLPKKIVAPSSNVAQTNTQSPAVIISPAGIDPNIDTNTNADGTTPPMEGTSKPKFLMNIYYSHNTDRKPPVGQQVPVQVATPKPIKPPADRRNLPKILPANNFISYFEDKELEKSFGVTKKQKYAILEEMNKRRAKIYLQSNINVLRWNETLAERAAAEINSCLYFNKGNGAIYAMIYEKYTGTSLISEAVGRWADEKNKFRLSVPCTDVKACRYSQIVWAETREVGCARQTCNDMSMVACMYDPPGNVIGEQAYKPGRACSRCAPGSRCNTDNLCEW
ncbi:putative mediator of RNA polymerase II transcription subunit 26 isoform X1 [Patella vulgata]|uniref:putative mediator of RNA polymerase II transcription subunit 26 isoform X1 n=1 Tax=Patella vulgata TaxID=6465 RepID=UPI00217F7D6A|nr:putative mediator of RNA polymerase II transcription subunit 26 isoform X1 [Patella vulgata]